MARLSRFLARKERNFTIKNRIFYVNWHNIMITYFLIVIPKSGIFLKKILKTARVAISIHRHHSQWSSRYTILWMSTEKFRCRVYMFLCAITGYWLNFPSFSKNWAIRDLDLILRWRCPIFWIPRSSSCQEFPKQQLQAKLNQSNVWYYDFASFFLFAIFQWRHRSSYQRYGLFTKNGS